jgi:hypothetical protein
LQNGDEKINSVFSVAQKLSMGALSKQFPVPLMEAFIPALYIDLFNTADVSLVLGSIQNLTKKYRFEKFVDCADLAEDIQIQTREVFRFLTFASRMNVTIPNFWKRPKPNWPIYPWS